MAAFSKPIVAAVNGTTMGLGVSILPLCDLVLASDKATFYIPYSDIGQSLEGGASLTFPKLSGSLVSTFRVDLRIGSDGLFFCRLGTWCTAVARSLPWRPRGSASCPESFGTTSTMST